jgi:hypothetical protein
VADDVDLRSREFETNLIIVLPIIMAIQNAAARDVEVSALSRTVEAFARSVHFWNIAYLVLLGLTFAASAVVVLRNNALSRAQAELASAKERNLASELKDKDSQIADTNERSKALGIQLEEQREKTANAEAAQQRVETQLAETRIKQAEAEKAIAPRVLDVWHHGDDKTNVDELKRFAGREFVIRYIPDAEAMRAASSLEHALTTAGLKMLRGEATMDIAGMWYDGVTIETYIKDVSPASMLEASTNGTFETADGIVEFLKANNWVARINMPGTSDIPPLAIRINVGFKTSPYFLTKETQEFHDKLKANEKLFEEMRRKASATPSPNP